MCSISLYDSPRTSPDVNLLTWSILLSWFVVAQKVCPAHDQTHSNTPLCVRALGTVCLGGTAGMVYVGPTSTFRVLVLVDRYLFS